MAHKAPPTSPSRSGTFVVLEAAQQLRGVDPEPVGDPDDGGELRVIDGILDPVHLGEGETGAAIGEGFLRQAPALALGPDVSRKDLFRSTGATMLCIDLSGYAETSSSTRETLSPCLDLAAVALHGRAPP
jgi:hypothetical protein